MYDHLLGYPEPDTLQPRDFPTPEVVEAGEDMFTSRYQRKRRRVYARARHMTESGGYAHPDVEDAEAEAALVRAQAQVSRARGDQLGWVRHMLRRGATARFGYRNPAEMVASRLDVRRTVARDLAYLAERLGDSQIEGIRQGTVSYERVLAEARLTEAGASADVVEASRDLDLEAVKRLLQAHRKMSRGDEPAVLEGQYVSLQPSSDGSHVQVKGGSELWKRRYTSKDSTGGRSGSFPPAKPGLTRDGEGA